MRYGLELPCGGDAMTLELLVQAGVEAEAAGWDGVFFEDYLVYYRGQDPSTFDPWIMMALIAARTTSVRLGTTVSGLLARDPVKLARAALTLDGFSRGRVILGVGLGDPADRGVLVAPDRPVGTHRGRRMDERLELLLSLLSGDPIGESGVRFRSSNESGSRVPVWVGGSWQAGAVVRRAARADGIVPYKLTDTSDWSDFTADEVRSIAAALDAHRATAGDEVDIAVGGRRRLADESAEQAAVDAAALGGATWWLEFVHPGPPGDLLRAVRRGPVRAA
jgi:alkanesulfonate monooxygenase SsuD/methylene tetrahydromethanopterin reductase-like flavin-dependent oxidoreductase (luciferase family)